MPSWQLGRSSVVHRNITRQYFYAVVNRMPNGLNADHSKFANDTRILLVIEFDLIILIV